MSVIPAEEAAAAAPQAPPPEPPAPKSVRERMEATFDKFVSEEGAAEPSAEKQPVDGTPNADQDDKATPPAEFLPSPEPEKLVLTAEQLADTATWGALDKEGWERMERDYPVETKLVKSAQAAATRIVNAARKEAQPTPEQRTAAPPEAGPSDDELDELLMSLDPKDVRRAHETIAERATLKTLKANGIDPQRFQLQSTQDAAYETAVATLPALAAFAGNDIAAVIKSSSALGTLVELGTEKSLAAALVGAGEILVERKKVADAQALAKKAEKDRQSKETQRVVQSNAKVASADALKSHGGSPDTRTLRERLNDRADAEIARQGGGHA